MTRCPLCDATSARPSWLGHTTFDGQSFHYVECIACGSLYCDPMPGAAVLARMYDHSYVPDDESADRRAVTEQLRSVPKGTFLDYGCGHGKLLQLAQELGWNAIGLEFDPAVAETVAKNTGARVVTRLEELGDSPSVDVIHLGDVLEHLTEMNTLFPEILRCLEPSGLFLAQGPLENNDCLFIRVLKGSRKWRGPASSQMPPYHVSLSTLAGQRALFRRFGLEEIVFRVTEVDWPAPSNLTVGMRPREAAMFALRKASQAASRLRPDALGNRYFFAGRIQRAGH